MRRATARLSWRGAELQSRYDVDSGRGLRRVEVGRGGGGVDERRRARWSSPLPKVGISQKGGGVLRDRIELDEDDVDG